MQLTPNLNLKKPELTDTVNVNDLNDNADILDTEVAKLASTTEAGRMSAADKTKLNGIATGAQVNTVTSVAGKTGAVVVTKGDVGLGNVDNVQQAPISHVGVGGTAHAAATTSAAGFMSAADKTKLDGVAAGANNYVHPATHAPSIIAQDANNRFMTDAERSKLSGIAAGANNYAHPTGDGNLHVPATGTTNNTRVLKAGAAAGSFAWGVVDWGELSGKPGVFTPAAHQHSGADITSGTVAAARLPSASTGAPGITQLNDTVTSTSTTQAATANAAKAAYDRGSSALNAANNAQATANGALQRGSGGTVNGPITLNGGGSDTPELSWFDPVNNTFVNADIYNEAFRLFSSYRGNSVEYAFHLELANRIGYVFGNQILHGGTSTQAKAGPLHFFNNTGVAGRNVAGSGTYWLARVNSFNQVQLGDSGMQAVIYSNTTPAWYNGTNSYAIHTTATQPKVTVSSSAPSGPAVGDVWIDTSS